MQFSRTSFNLAHARARERGVFNQSANTNDYDPSNENMSSIPPVETQTMIGLCVCAHGTLP